MLSTPSITLSPCAPASCPATPPGWSAIAAYLSNRGGTPDLSPDAARIRRRDDEMIDEEYCQNFSAHYQMLVNCDGLPPECLAELKQCAVDAGADLTRIAFANINLPAHTHLVEQDLSGMHLFALDATSTSFERCNFSESQINSSSMHDTTFTACDLSEMYLDCNCTGRLGIIDSTLHHATFEEDLFSGDLRVDCSGSTLSHLELSGLEPAGLTCRGTIFDHVNLSLAELRGGDFTDSRLNAVNFELSRLAGSNLSNTIFNDVNLSDTLMDGCNFTRGNFRDVRCNRAELVGCNLSHTTLYGVDLRGALVSGCDFPQASLEAIRTNDGTRFESTNFLHGTTVSGKRYSSVNADFLQALNETGKPKYIGG